MGMSKDIKDREYNKFVEDQHGKTAIRLSQSGQFPDFKLQVAAGKIQGAKLLYKFGRNPDVLTDTTHEVIWNYGGTYTFPTTATTLSLSSTSIEDNGILELTGAHTVKVDGLDVDFNEISEIVTLNGITPVVTIGEYIRVHRMTVILSGSVEVNLGPVTAIHAGTGLPVAQVATEEGQTMLCVYTVPAGKTLYIESWFISLFKKQSVSGTFHFEVKPPCCSWNIKQVVGATSEGSSSSTRTLTSPIVIAEKTDIRVVIHDVTVSGTNAFSSFEGIIIDNDTFDWGDK